MNGANAPLLKRKTPHSVDERPSKHHRSLHGGKESAGDNTPENVDDYMDEEEDEADDDGSRLQRLLQAGADSAEWQATIQRVVRNVVSIRFCLTCSFDTDPALTSEATGFVVDAEKGYVSRSHARDPPGGPHGRC